MDKLDLTILIPAYNEEKNIINLLRNVANSLANKNIITEVLILPNGCIDRTIEVVSSFIKGRNNNNIGWKLINIDRGGKTHALNIGLKMARSDIIINLDADCAPADNCVFRIYDELLNNSNLMLVGVLDVPNFSFMNKTTLLYQYERTQQIWREERGRVIPIGAAMGYKKSAFLSFPENIHSEDTWAALQIAKTYGWQSVKVLTDVILNTLPPATWFDYISQQTRWDAGYVQIMERFPDLQVVYNSRRKHFQQKGKEEIIKSVKVRLHKEKIPVRRLKEISDIIDIIIIENGETMKGKLIREDGTWDPIISTKSIPLQNE